MNKQKYNLVEITEKEYYQLKKGEREMKLEWDMFIDTPIYYKRIYEERKK